MKKYIIKIIKPYFNPKDSKLLEIGCGNGRFGKILGDLFLEYDGIDPFKLAIKEAIKENKHKNVIYKVGKAEQVPIKKKFDIIFYSFSFHFIKNFEKAFLEANRLLRPNGIIFILEPSQTPYNWKSGLLNKDSCLFSEDSFRRKVGDLVKAERAINKNDLFKIIFHEVKKHDIYILKKQKTS